MQRLKVSKVFDLDAGGKGLKVILWEEFGIFAVA